MQALTIRQPWASMIADGRKTIETRTRQISYRGPLAIVAGKTADIDACARFRIPPTTMPLGRILAVADLAGCRPMTEDDNAAAMTEYPSALAGIIPGMYAWILKNVRRIRPGEEIPCRGMPSLFNPEVSPETILATLA